MKIGNQNDYLKPQLQINKQKVKYVDEILSSLFIFQSFSPISHYKSSNFVCGQVVKIEIEVKPRLETTDTET